MMTRVDCAKRIMKICGALELAFNSQQEDVFEFITFTLHDLEQLYDDLLCDCGDEEHQEEEELE